MLISHKAALGSTSTCTDQPRYLAARRDHTEPERLLRPVPPFPTLAPNGPLLSRLMSRCALKPVRGGGIGLITSSELIIFKTWWLCWRAHSDAAGAPCQRCTPPPIQSHRGGADLSSHRCHWPLLSQHITSPASVDAPALPSLPGTTSGTPVLPNAGIRGAGTGLAECYTL